ncbi:MAG: gamma-glutamyl-gamma-aminobutyrate hydrolase family protein [Cyclobacteriaceae bacterium]
MIKLGISAGFEYTNRDRTVFGPKTLSYIENDMARYVSRKGILPVLIPDIEASLQKGILDEMDGFLFQGGADIAPETYGEQPLGRWRGDRVRDVYELDILDYAIKNRKPVLGICRGFQLMNVYFGGTLYQDILTQNPDCESHRVTDLYDAHKHEICFVAGSFFAELYEKVEHPRVNSIHHQAVKELGEDLDVYARSPDGLIEAFGYREEPAGKVMGVQWHPEFTPTMPDELIEADQLFEAFLSHLKS